MFYFLQIQGYHLFLFNLPRYQGDEIRTGVPSSNHVNFWRIGNVSFYRLTERRCCSKIIEISNMVRPPSTGLQELAKALSCRMSHSGGSSKQHAFLLMLRPGLELTPLTLWNVAFSPLATVLSCLEPLPECDILQLRALASSCNTATWGANHVGNMNDSWSDFSYLSTPSIFKWQLCRYGS